MIPLVSIGNFISFLASFFSSIRLYSAYKKSKNIEIGYFFGSTAFITLYFFDISLPGLLINDNYVLGFTNAISLPIALVSCLFFAIIPLELIKLEKFKKLYISIIAITIILVLLLRALAFSPLRRVEKENFVFWLRPVDSRIKVAHLIGGLVTLISLLISGASFLFYGFKNRRDSYIFRRSLLLGGGATSMGVTAGVNYIMGSTPNIQTLISGSLLAVISLMLILSGVLYRKKE